MGRRDASWALLGVFVIVLIFVSIAGNRRSPRDLRDPRLSVNLSGPNGGSGFAEAMRRLGVPVELWEQPLSRLDEKTVGSNDWLALLGLAGSGGRDDLDDRDVIAVLDWLERGGAVLIVGPSSVAACLGTRVVRTTAEVPMNDERLPSAKARIESAGVDDDTGEREITRPAEERCAAVTVSKTVETLRNQRGAPVVRLEWLKGGGRLLIIADVGYLANETLRDTEAGEVLLPLLLGERPSRLLVDEYDHGFGARPSLLGATWSWMTRNPAGWAMLHLGAVGLVTLVALGIRFGPALSAVERHRRSPLEHLEALATGLERAGASDTAVQLIASGLQRRLGRFRVGQRSGARTGEWLDGLALSAQTARAKAAAGRLASALTNRGDQGSVLAAAHAVEDVWEALQLPSSYKTS